MMKRRIANGHWWGTVVWLSWPNTAYMTASKRSAKQAASSFPDRGEVSASRALQLRISGATTTIPETSPCHHVHQFAKTSGDDSAWPKTSGIVPTVAATVALK